MSASVTTIIPTFRRPELLRRAVNSALAQTYDAVQVAVYDNASGDATASVVADIAAKDSRVSYYCHSATVPVAQNFTFGMQRVNTPYFSFLSDDDVLFPNFYASACAQLRQEPDALFAAGSAIEFDESGSVRYAPLALWAREGRYQPPEGFLEMLGNKHPTFTAVLFRREVIDKVGLLDPDIPGPADLDYELRVAARFPYTVFFEACAAYVHHSDRLSALEDVSVLSGFERMTETLCADPRIDAALRARIPALLARQMRSKLYEIAVKAVVAGKDDNAQAAATMLRNRFARPLAASVIEATIAACKRMPPMRRALASMEALRVAQRAARARQRLRATTGHDASAYAKFIMGHAEHRP